MKFLRIYEEFDFTDDDFDFEEDSPFDFDSFKVIDLYHHIGNINDTINWVFDNLMSKKVEIYNRDGGAVFIGKIKSVKMVDSNDVILRRIKSDIDGDMMKVNSKVIYLKDTIKTV